MWVSDAAFLALASHVTLSILDREVSCEASAAFAENAFRACLESSDRAFLRVGSGTILCAILVQVVTGEGSFPDDSDGALALVMVVAPRLVHSKVTTGVVG